MTKTLTALNANLGVLLLVLNLGVLLLVALLTRRLAKDKLGLFVKSLGQYGKHATAKNAGFRKDDVLVELNGKSARITEGELIGQLLQTTKPGETLKATVQRGDQRVELLLPMQ